MQFFKLESKYITTMVVLTPCLVIEFAEYIQTFIKLDSNFANANIWCVSQNSRLILCKCKKTSEYFLNSSPKSNHNKISLLSNTFPPSYSNWLIPQKPILHPRYRNRIKSPQRKISLHFWMFTSLIKTLSLHSVTIFKIPWRDRPSTITNDHNVANFPLSEENHDSMWSRCTTDRRAGLGLKMNYFITYSQVL